MAGKRTSRRKEKEVETSEDNKLEQPKLFDFLTAIFLKKDMPYQKNIAPAYILTLWLSYDKALLPIVNKINRLQFVLPDDIIYKYFWYAVPTGRRFIKWPKKTEKEKRVEEKINNLCDEYQISKKEAKLYVR